MATRSPAGLGLWSLLSTAVMVVSIPVTALAGMPDAQVPPTTLDPTPGNNRQALENKALGVVAMTPSIDLTIGQSFQLGVATQGPVKRLQWRKNGKNIEGATSPLLLVEPAFADAFSSQSPDKYTVVIEDAFGNTAQSPASTVQWHPSESAAPPAQWRRWNSIRLRTLFNLVHVFEHVAGKIEEPWQYTLFSKVDPRIAQWECAGRAQQWLQTNPEQQGSTTEIAQLHFDQCFLSRTNGLGKEQGYMVDGKWIHLHSTLLETDTSINTDTLTAQNLRISFPKTTIAKTDDPVSFETVLQGQITRKSTRSSVIANTERTLNEYSPQKGTWIVNPQTRLYAKYLGGSYSVEMLSGLQSGNRVVQQENRFFNNLRWNINGQEVLIRGVLGQGVTENGASRSGQLEVQIDGRTLIKTSNPLLLDTTTLLPLPWAPRLNGYFLNEIRVNNPDLQLEVDGDGETQYRDKTITRRKKASAQPAQGFSTMSGNSQ